MGAAQTSRKFCGPNETQSSVTGLCSRGNSCCLSEPASFPAPYGLESWPLSQCVNTPAGVGAGGEAVKAGDFGGIKTGRKGDPRGHPFSVLFHFLPET